MALNEDGTHSAIGTLPARPPQNYSVVLSNHGLAHSGGIERYLLTLVDGLHAMAIRPTVVAHKFDRAIPEYQWVDPVHLRTWGLGGALRDRLFDIQLRRAKRRGGWYPLIALSQTSAADIAICGGTHWGFLEATDRRPKWKDRLTISLERQHLEHARMVIAHSRLMAEQVKKFYQVDPAKINVLYPPVDTDQFSTVSEDVRSGLRAKFGFPSDRCIFLLASTGHARKGLDLLVKALGHSQLPVQLVVVGRPPDMEAPNLRYLGYRTDIQDVYRAVDCTVMASRYEPFGLVGVETVLCGTPLIGAMGMGCMEVLHGEGVMPFRIGAEEMASDSFEHAIQTAMSRWREGRLRLANPMASLKYDPSVTSHLQALLRHADLLRDAHVSNQA